jgi:hypothetical protein
MYHVSHKKLPNLLSFPDFPNETPKIDLTSRKLMGERRSQNVVDDNDEEDEVEDDEEETHLRDSSGVSGIDVEMADMSNSITDQSSP